MSIKFSLRIDDQKHSLTKENGIAIDLIGEILLNLGKAIGDNHVVLHEIRGSCYALGFVTESEKVYSNFTVVHSNISTKPFCELSLPEKEYAKVLKKLMKRQQVYVEALDSNNKPLVRISSLPESQTLGHIHYTQTIYGTIIALGSKNESKMTMVVKSTDGQKPTIQISDSQMAELRKHLELVYRNADFKMVLNVRSSLSEEKYFYALESFEVPSRNLLFDELEKSLSRNGQVFDHIEDAGQAVREIR